jgi:hypothetical protein
VKTIFKIAFALVAAGIFLTVAAPAQAAKPETNAPAVTAVKTNAPVLPPKSAFTQPTSNRDGHDPFFPESNRIFDSQVAVAHATETVTTLTVKGFSVVRGRPMVIINNHSFMVGDEGDVLGAGGSRAHVHCLEIKNGTVIVELNGARHELHY